MTDTVCGWLNYNSLDILFIISSTPWLIRDTDGQQYPVLGTVLVNGKVYQLMSDINESIDRCLGALLSVVFDKKAIWNWGDRLIIQTPTTLLKLQTPTQGAVVMGESCDGPGKFMCEPSIDIRNISDHLLLTLSSNQECK